MKFKNACCCLFISLIFVTFYSTVTVLAETTSVGFGYEEELKESTSDNVFPDTDKLLPSLGSFTPMNCILFGVSILIVCFYLKKSLHRKKEIQ